MSRLNYTNQHFLRDPQVSQYMVSLAEINASDCVLEIGPGDGFITKELIGRAKRVIAIESDPNLANDLRRQFSRHPSLEVVVGNALTCPWPRKIDKIVSNIPFNITEPLFERLYGTKFELASLLIGDNMAKLIEMYKLGELEEITSRRLPLLTNAYFHTSYEREVPSDRFDPEPSVNGAIITLRPRDKKDLGRDPALYLVRAVWDQRTRSVGDSLFNGFRNLIHHNSQETYITKEAFLRFLESASVSSMSGLFNRRGSSLTGQQFTDLYVILRDKKFKKRLFRLNRNLHRGHYDTFEDGSKI